MVESQKIIEDPTSPALSPAFTAVGGESIYTPTLQNVQIMRDLLPLRDKVRIKKNLDLFCQGRCRFNLIFVIVPICYLIIPFVVPITLTYALNALYSLQFIIYLILATICHFKIRSRTDPNATMPVPSTAHNLTHILMTCFYKEPYSLISDTLKELKKQIYTGRYILLLCVEQKTPERERKIQKIVEDYGNLFKEIVITVHPANIQGEIPGKCSNSNYGSRCIYSMLANQNKDFNPSDYIITNFDIDTRFHPDFLQHLTNQVLLEKQRDRVVWQPILYYNWGLDKLSFVTRITGLLRNAMMMGSNVPLNINVMSVYSATLKLYEEGEFIHPAYQMDDIICYIRWMLKTRTSMKIMPVYVPVLSGPTSGSTLIIEIKEWARQLRRWSIGGAEVFHYFCIKFRKIKVLTALWWGFKFCNYYIGFACAQSLMMISTCIATFLFQEEDFNNSYFLILLGVFYLCVFWMIVLNIHGTRKLKIIGVTENISFIRNFGHLISSLFVLIVYSWVAFYGFVEVFVRGKKVCKHGASQKSDLIVIKRKSLSVENINELYSPNN